jgi:hypothetical protein
MYRNAEKIAAETRARLVARHIAQKRHKTLLRQFFGSCRMIDPSAKERVDQIAIAFEKLAERFPRASLEIEHQLIVGSHRRLIGPRASPVCLVCMTRGSYKGNVGNGQKVPGGCEFSTHSRERPFQRGQSARANAGGGRSARNSGEAPTNSEYSVVIRDGLMGDARTK